MSWADWWLIERVVAGVGTVPWLEEPPKPVEWEGPIAIAHARLARDIDEVLKVLETEAE